MKKTVCLIVILQAVCCSCCRSTSFKTYAETKYWQIKTVM